MKFPGLFSIIISSVYTSPVQIVGTLKNISRLIVNILGW